MSAELHAELMDVPARVGLILHLRTMVVDGAADDVLEDLLEDLDADDIRKLWPNMPEDAVDSFMRLEWDEVEHEKRSTR